jgi:hypothetical protein
MTKPFFDLWGSVRATFPSRSRMYAAVASVSISTIGGRVIGMIKLLTLLFPISGDDPALIAFNLCDCDQNFTSKRTREQPNEPAVISSSHRRFDYGYGLIDREHCFLNAEATLASPLFDVSGVVELARHRTADYAFAQRSASLFL